MANLQNPVKAIRAKCLDCMCGQVTEVTLCPSTSCALYPFRMGKNPYRTIRERSDEEKAKIATRLAEGRKAVAAEREKAKEEEM